MVMLVGIASDEINYLEEVLIIHILLL